MVTAHRFYNELGGEENHLHNRPEVEFIPKSFAPRAWFQAVFPTFHSAGWVVWFCPAGCCPWRWGGCARDCSFSQTLFSFFFLTKHEDLSNDLKYAVTSLRCTAKHSTSFTLSLFIYFYLVILFAPAWGAAGGTSTVMLCDASAALQTKGPHSPWAPWVVVTQGTCTATTQGACTVRSLPQAPARLFLNLQSSCNWWPRMERRASLPETLSSDWVWNFGDSLLVHRLLFNLKSERNNEHVMSFHTIFPAAVRKGIKC